MTSLTLVRRIAARPSIVFDVLTTADGIATWWAPGGLLVTRAEFDARVGGAYLVRFRTPDGAEHEACGECLELIEPRRLVLSWRWASGGEIEQAGRVSRIEISLTPIENGTELTFTHRALANDRSRGIHERGGDGEGHSADPINGAVPQQRHDFCRQRRAGERGYRAAAQGDSGLAQFRRLAG